MSNPTLQDEPSRIRARLRFLQHTLMTKNILGEDVPMFSDAGWEGVPDDCPPWTATVTAAWAPPRISWYNFSSAVGMTAVFAAVVVSGSIHNPSIADLLLLVLPLLPALWALWQLRHRGPRQSLQLVLGPERLRLTSDLPGVLPVELMRANAGSLWAFERIHGRPRRLRLCDDRGRQVAEFADQTASVQAVDWPENAALSPKMRVAVLVGSWWPHPARRTVGLYSLWADPDITQSVRWESNDSR
jgi:hypothetical protein